MAKTLAERLATGDPEGINHFLSQHGFAPARDYVTLVANINRFIQDAPDEDLMDLMNLHPDREIFEEILVLKGNHGHHGHHKDDHHEHGRRQPLPHQQHSHHNCCGHHNADGFNNCSGCGGKCGQYNNASGGASASNWGGGFAQNAFYATLFAVTIVSLVSLARNPREVK